MDTWEIFTLTGTLAFALSGALVALDEKYDLFGVYTLGFITAFGGGMIRNVVIGLPVSEIWAQTTLFVSTFVLITLIFVVPSSWFRHWFRWGVFFDAVGLSAFAIQGALFAQGANESIVAVMMAAVLTGVGGGVVRDVLAGRKPMVLHSDIYAGWALLAGLVVGLGLNHAIFLYVLFGTIVVLRMLTNRYSWRLPVVQKAG
ncbi:trimeric intracellular cation channel family protein [Shouchella shacheensis]|uniref:trimeric intracellular cation channel family protein n=1 Tax=Shouchella shacheensis TaxID=1649580 RepID=UPI000A760F86|nr:trimeric intracellular cation channel family protein [Shouchella shacheensis]